MWKSITWLLSTRDSRMLARLTQFWGSPTGVASTTRELAWPAPGPADSSAADVQAASATASGTTRAAGFMRSEEHTSELQSLIRISYAVFCLKKKKHNKKNTHQHH